MIGKIDGVIIGLLENGLHSRKSVAVSTSCWRRRIAVWIEVHGATSLSQVPGLAVIVVLPAQRFESTVLLAHKGWVRSDVSGVVSQPQCGTKCYWYR